MLVLEDVHSYYGPSHILQGVGLKVKQGEVVALLGKNGMGKTTTFKAIMGLIPQTLGKIIFQKSEITCLPPYKIARFGIGYVPQGKMIFPNLTVMENLIMGASNSKNPSSEYINQRLGAIFSYFPDLKSIANRRGGLLSGGEQQMLAIARALMGDIKLMLLDEPSESLAPIYVQKTFEIVKKLRESGITILLAEQNIKKALEVADRCYIIEKGRITFEGTPKEVESSSDARAMIGV